MPKKLICGIGVNDADYVIKRAVKYKDEKGKSRSKLMWSCRVYSSWKSMIERVYGTKPLNSRPTYISVSICKDWLIFSNFKKWVDTLGYNIEGLSLDKDILTPNTEKIYCPEYCAFVTKTVNSFVLDFGNTSAKLVRQRTENCYEARVIDTITKKEILFYSDNYEDCRKYSVAEKVRIAKELAKLEPDIRIKERLPKMIEEKYK